ncbi:MAG: Arabinanase/levansucrase/invertase [Aureobasidium pullulans]|nr:MAG: Arabinanase/levansucrase/invertase [Aureobasidium pullulans]
MFNHHTTSTQVVTKVHGAEQGAPWVVHEVFKLRVSTEAPNLTMVRARKSTVPPHRRKAVATEDVVLEQSVKLLTTVTGSGLTSATGEADVADPEDGPEGGPEGGPKGASA